MIYDFDQITDRRGTFCTQWDYIKDRFAEADLLPFSISDTDFRVPVQIENQLAKVVHHGIYGYSRWNHSAFKGAVAGYFKSRHHTEVQEEWVVYSPSVLYTISALFDLLGEKGDKILVLNPMYDAFFHLIRDNGRKLVSLDLDRTENGYTIDFNRFEELAKDCRIFLLCSPHNPTGRVWTRGELEEMAKICRKTETVMISDEIHSDIILGDKRHIPILDCQDPFEPCFLVSSASKTFNTPGLIGSYAVLPDPAVREAFISRMRNQEFLNSVSLLGMHAMITGYRECMDYADQLSAYVRGNMEYLDRFVRTELSGAGVEFTIPEATYLAWIRVEKVRGDARAIQDALVHQGKVGILSGELYGDPNYLRMNLGCPRSKVEEGLRRMKKGILSIARGA